MSNLLVSLFGPFNSDFKAQKRKKAPLLNNPFNSIYLPIYLPRSQPAALARG